MRKGWLALLAGAVSVASHGRSLRSARRRVAAPGRRSACVRMRCASARSAARSRGYALCGRAGRHEPLRKVCRALRSQLHPSQHLFRRGARYSRAKEPDRSADRLLRADRAQSRDGIWIAYAARCAIGGRRGQCARRLRWQALQADGAQRLRQLAGQGGLRRRPAH